MDDPAQSKKVVKAARKILKKKGSAGSMKLKELAKLVANQMDKGENYKEIKKCLSNSEKLCVEGKVVCLSSKDMKRRLEGGDAQSNVRSKKARVSKDEKVTSASDDDKFLSSIETWRKDNKIVVMHCKDDEIGIKGTKKINKDPVFFPFTGFSDCKNTINNSLIRQCTEANGFKKPSPIQAQSWPILMNKKRDIVGIAETGSGKTLAFSIPALSLMTSASDAKSNRRLPQMLVLSPTRELAMQVEKVLEEYGNVVGIKSIVLYGGVPKYIQTTELKKGCIDCIVATPGRLLDLINDGTCNLSKVQYLVLDEADRMLDMGFEEDVKYIISNCMPKEDGRQTAMFSATWPAAIQEIAMNYMVDPIRLYVGFDGIVGSNGENCVNDSLSANKRVDQIIEVIEDRQRENRLRELLRKNKKLDRILIFGLYKKEVERLEYSLKREGFNVCSIHGNKHQAARTQALAEFKDGSTQIMIGTDVAARGLDIPNVGLVLNYTFPLTIEDYVHRIGRTGRAGKSGVSYTFFQPSDKSHAGELQQVMKQAGRTPPEALMKFGSTIKAKEHKLYGNFGPKGGPMKKATKIVFD